MLSNLHSKARSTIAALAIIAGLTLGSTANAGWVFINESDNPSSQDGSPDSAGSADVTAWLNTLIAPDTAGSIIASQDYDGVEYNGETINLPAGSNPEYLVLHFGGQQQTEDVFWAFSCEPDVATCLSFTIEGIFSANSAVLNTREVEMPDNGLSFYRVYGTRTSVPEPSILPLLGLGLLGVAFAGRRKAR